ncbi:MAG: choice-of-anchor D domain-containing protein [Halioglobus sp.]|nr:choice-of-anchor D domain-containing protein [Halioglobus sp.]
MRTRNSSKKSRFPAARTSIFLATFIATSPFTRAAPVDWLNDADGLWNDASLWSSNPALPGAADDVSITNVTGLKTVTHDTGSDTIKSLTTNDSARVLVNGGSSLRINSGGNNAGILQAGGASAGTLTFAGGTLTNTSGELLAGNDGIIELTGVNVVGGELNSSGNGSFLVSSSNANFLRGISLNGVLDMTSISNSRQRVTDNMTLDGTVDLNKNSILSFEGNNLLDGNGSVVFGGTGAGNRLDLDGNGTTTVGSGITIRGDNGTIGQQLNIAGTQVLVNEGLISADVSGGIIAIRESAVTNNNVLEARNGGTLDLRSQVDNSAGEIRADNGVVGLSGMRVIGGELSSAGSGNFRVNSSAANFLENVTVTGLLDMATNSNTRQRVTDNMTLDGTVQINNNGLLSFEGNNLLDGSGTVIFGDTGPGNRLDLDGNGTTTVGAGITIRGENGSIGRQLNIGGTQVLVNEGLISADVNGGTINIQESAVTNNNVMEARNGGTLDLRTDVDNSAGEILADNSVVNLNGMRVEGGQMNSTGTGKFLTTSSFSNFLEAVTLTGKLDMATNINSRQRIVNGLTLDGTIDINNNGILSFEGNNSLDGNGTVIFGATGPGNRFDLDGNGTTTLGSDITIRGENGTIGNQINIGGTQTLVNNGLISADVNGGTITVLQSEVTNNNVMEARNGATLDLRIGIDNSAGEILADNSVVNLTGMRVKGGQLNSTGTGKFLNTSSSANFLEAVALTGTLDMATNVNTRQRIVDGLTLDGTIDINNNGILSFEGNNSLDGNGTVIFGASGSGNRLDLDGNGTTTLGSDITIRGENGTIGNQINIGGNQTLVNNGLISADVTGGTITIIDSKVNNNTVLEARNGANLVLRSDINNAASAEIHADNSLVSQEGIRVTGGTITTVNGGTFRANTSAANYLDAISIDGTLDMASIVNSRERVVNDMTLNGTIDLNGNGILSFEGNNVLDGNGTVILGDTGSGNRVVLDGNGTTTIESGITIRGENGTIGDQFNIGGTQTLVNNGLVSADVSGGTLTITDSAVDNNNVLEARNGGTLVLDSNVNNSVPGQIHADNGIVIQSGQRVTGGTISSDNSGVFRVTSNTANYLDGATVTGDMDMSSIANSRERVVNGLTLDGLLNLNLNGHLSFEGNNTLDGSGTLVLGETGSGNLITLEGNGTTVIGSGVTIRGENGTIGNQTYIGGTQVLANNGTINSDGGGTITLTESAVTNNGLLRAQNGILTSQVQVSGTGTIQVDSTGVMNLANVANTQGELKMGAAGAALNVGTQNLTINSDYTNTAAGTGNSFDRRAGVSGAGQIVAGGDVAQAITGSGVTDGSTPNATLTIGNMRVGANTFNYQVANTGSTGPSLRGAIQTNVNGGNIDDARLSGAGVTASNYNTGGPGSDTGDLAVVFTAATAGALAPLVDQKVNLRSNFENIVDQHLNIVLAGDAAAYNAAVGDAGTPVQVANQRVGGTNTAAVTVTNAAPAGSFSEDLNAAVNGMTGDANGIGSIAGLLAGASNNSGAISVAVDTSSAGARSGTVTLDYETTGTVNGVSNGLGVASAGSQAVEVNGNVYQVAQVSAPLPATIELGNFRAGSGPQSAPGINITNTDIAPSGFQEGLDAVIGTVTGQATGSGFSNAAAGNSGTINVGLSAINAGLNTGTVDVQFNSNGITTSGSNGLGDLALGGPETITINGTGWRLAEANLQPATINFGNVLIGSAQAQFLDIQNIAANDGFSERLDAIFKAGGTTGDATNNGGSIDLLAAGSSNNSAMAVGIDTSSIGSKTGQVVVAFNSNGSGTSELGITGLPDQAIGVLANVEANVGTLAQPGPVTPNPVDFGKVRIDSAPVGPVDLSITNNAVVGEGLNAAISTLDSGFAANGAFASLAAGATDNSSLQVQFTGTDTAGAHTGTATVELVSDGSFNGGQTTNLPSQTVDMSAEVYRLANALLNTTSVDVVARVGDAVSADQAVSISNASPDIYTEGLKVNIAGSTGNAQGNGGSIANLAAQGTDNSSIKVGLASTATAGVTSDSVNFDFISTGAGTTGAADVAAQVASGSVTVNGKVYAPAIGQLNTPTVDFGIVRVGDVVGPLNINVKNAANTVALNDTLRANLSGVGSAFTADSTVGNIASGNNGNLAVGLNTGTAGIYNQTGTVSFLSQNPDMADVSAGSDGTVQVSAQVNNLANAHFDLLSSFGTLSQSGDNYLLDLGNILLGDSRSSMLQLENDIFGPADFLMGSFDLTAIDDFLFTGWDPFSGLAAGDAFGGLNIDFTAIGLGLFEDTVAFNGFGYNDSDPNGLAQSRNLLVRINVIDGNSVPAPGTVLLVLLGLLAMRQQLRARKA